MRECIAEFIGTFFPVLTFGVTVMTGAFAVGSISGGAFTPGRRGRPGHHETGEVLRHVDSAWADLAGGLVAGLPFEFLNPDDK